MGKPALPNSERRSGIASSSGRSSRDEAWARPAARFSRSLERLVATRSSKRSYELGNIARRLSFLGDGRMLLAELKIRSATAPPVRVTLSKESEIAAEDRP